MRKKHLDDGAAREILQRARHGHLAGTTSDGRPIVRTLHHAILEDGLYFHGSAGGEKDELFERDAVFECVEEIAAIPSYWVDARRACPATTYYRSVQVHGRVEFVECPRRRAAAMRALMERLQPEGGYVPLTHDAPEYAAALRAFSVFRLSMERICGRVSVGQSRGAPTMHRVLAGLWERGDPGDVAAIETILDLRSDVMRPAWLRACGAYDLVVRPTDTMANEAARLLQPTYWNGAHSLHALALAQSSASAWVGARDPATGRLVGSVAALSNRTKHAWIFDVVVDPGHRGRGLGTALVERLLDHPNLRDTRLISLRTRDAHDFYRRFGFTDADNVPNPSDATTMLRLRERPDTATDA